MIEKSPTTDSSKWQQLLLLALIQWLAMTLWFSASAVAGPLTEVWQLSGGKQAWLTISVQLGFVIGAFVSAVFNLADRIAPPRLMAMCSLLGAGLNAAIPLAITDELGKSDSGFLAVVLLRMATGVMLAGVYPVGMKLMATWFVRGRGLAIGVLVGALTVGSASPHLMKAFVEPEKWPTVMIVSSAAAVAAAILAATLARTGPHLPSAAKFDWTYFARMWRDEAVRRANFGYLGHMFELYAMWAWAPVLVAQSLHKGGYTAEAQAQAGFAVIAAGGAGCILAGLWADRIGRTYTTIACLVVSGGCALVAGSLFSYPLLLVAVCIVWGFAVVADSAQFSTAISELCDPQYVGTALTIQTCAGFLLTTLTIRAVPAVLGDSSSPNWPLATAMLAIGPLFGIYHMAMLRQLRAAEKMAGGMR
ncbi:MAG TPA: MFS transporter [Pirellulaceae bacterium]|nr:MFS transporter [Pirellulaceae bacterium]